MRDWIIFFEAVSVLFCFPCFPDCSLQNNPLPPTHPIFYVVEEGEVSGVRFDVVVDPTDVIRDANGAALGPPLSPPPLSNA